MLKNSAVSSIFSTNLTAIAFLCSFLEAVRVCLVCISVSYNKMTTNKMIKTTKHAREPVFLGHLGKCEKSAPGRKVPNNQSFSSENALCKRIIIK